MEKILKPETTRYKTMMAISKLRDPEVLKACLQRGFPPEKAVFGSMADRINWLIDHYNDPIIKGKVETAISLFPDLKPRISTNEVVLMNLEKAEDVVKKEAKVPKKPKSERKEKSSEFNIFKGTKKEFTYELTRDLHKKFGKKYSNKELISSFSDQVFAKVTNKFGQASDKSVKIWMKRYLDGLG